MQATGCWVCTTAEKEGQFYLAACDAVLPTNSSCVGVGNRHCGDACFLVCVCVLESMISLRMWAQYFLTVPLGSCVFKDHQRGVCPEGPVFCSYDCGALVRRCDVSHICVVLIFRLCCCVSASDTLLCV